MKTSDIFHLTMTGLLFTAMSFLLILSPIMAVEYYGTTAGCILVLSCFLTGIFGVEYTEFEMGL